jgi:hypothetical protein
MNEAALKADRGADVVGFRFNQAFTIGAQTQTLADYDMILFFPTGGTNPNTAFAAEAEAIAQYMENGGGFFATGDHANLGSQICGLLPRVRSMRRWWSPNAGPNGEPVAPPPLGPTRHDTTRPGPDNVMTFEDQSDDIAMEITPTVYNAGFTIRQGYPAQRFFPHPLLCSPEGMVTWLPDHMHEGWCEVPGNLATRTFTIGNTTLREYPDYAPPNTPGAPLAPEIVATGQVLPGATSPAVDPAHVGDSTPANGKSFGVIGAWDGHLVGKGRVVVDSTWHHFFDINLSGDRFLEDNNLPTDQTQKLYGFYVPGAGGARVPNTAYRLIMWYFRNIVYWLIPAQRHAPLWWHTLLSALNRPRLNEELLGNFGDYTLEHYHYFGQLAERYLQQARGACATYEIHRYIFEIKIPWWEWVQEIVQVWDPAFRRNSRLPDARSQWLGMIGAAPQPQAALTIALGAALVAAAAVRAEGIDDAEPEQAVQKVRKLFPQVLKKAAGEFGKALKSGMEIARAFESVAAQQLKYKATK